jgi:hypothetical protein
VRPVIRSGWRLCHVFAFGGLYTSNWGADKQLMGVNSVHGIGGHLILYFVVILATRAYANVMRGTLILCFQFKIMFKHCFLFIDKCGFIYILYVKTFF